jgi:hypothetical protein
MEGEEITTHVYSEDGTLKRVHINAINPGEEISPIFPAKGTSVVSTIRQNLASITSQAARTGRPILAQINHPNWPNYDISPQDLGQATDAQFFELANECGDNLNAGNATHPNTQKMWDIANTIRIGRLGKNPLFATATDDAHFYNNDGGSSAPCAPGIGWVSVRANSLTTSSVLDAMNRGDFYASTGVDLRDVSFASNVLNVEVAPEDGVSYTIDFVGTRKGVDPDKKADGTYSDAIGEVLASVTGTHARYMMTGDELYVRAVIHSSKIMTLSPWDETPYEQAWTQPVTYVVPEPGVLAMVGIGCVCVGFWTYRRRLAMGLGNTRKLETCSAASF